SSSWPTDGISIPADVDGKPTASIKVAPDFQEMGDVTIAFYVIDNAGMKSAETGSAIIHFSTTHEVSGIVFYDADGLSNHQVDGNVIAGNLGLNMVLVSAIGEVSGVSIVNISNGTYHLTEVPNGDYILVLTTEKPSIGAVAPMPNLPGNWKYMGEN